VLSLFRRQPIIRLNLQQPFQPVPVRSLPIVLLRSTDAAEANCAEIAYARYRREQAEAQLEEFIETQRLQRWA
jgi:hypothetical protein